MSASLVGSEMCIRDSPSSPSTAPMRRAVSGPLGTQRTRRQPRATSTAPCSRTVSYTHLRAHETSAHL
eukprot:8664651-Alexandrium_andersonii.AAC.1